MVTGNPSPKLQKVVEGKLQNDKAKVKDPGPGNPQDTPSVSRF
jgi:hypothetical protein